MKVEEIEKTLPNGRSLPGPIASICEYLEEYGYPISGCFELSTIGMDNIRDWFPNDPESYEQFSPFGRGACGDIYALWLHSSHLSIDGPVVMFGSEGKYEVLAEDSFEFCRLLCLGYSEIGLEPFDSLPSDYHETECFREFMINRYGFEPPATAKPIVKKAHSSTPDFNEFIMSRQHRYA